MKESEFKSDFFLLLIAPTGGPEGLSCISSGSTSLRLSWHPPALDTRGGLITHYTLQYTRRDADPLQPSQDAYLRVQVKYREAVLYTLFEHTNSIISPCHRIVYNNAINFRAKKRLCHG